MKNLPKNLKFNIIKEEKFFLEAGLATNKHWMVRVSWLLGLEKNKKLGQLVFANKIVKEQVKVVTQRIKGDTEYTKLNQEGLLKSLDLKHYREIPREEIKFHLGFVSKNSIEKDIAYLSLGTSTKTTYLDVNYSAVLFFDLSTRIFFSAKDNEKPVILKDSPDQIVFALSPLSPKGFEGVI